MFHKHQWKEVARTYAEPKNVQMPQSKLIMMHDHDLNILMHGLTTIIWECQICGNLRREEMLGKQSFKWPNNETA